MSIKKYLTVIFITGILSTPIHAREQIEILDEIRKITRECTNQATRRSSWTGAVKEINGEIYKICIEIYEPILKALDIELRDSIKKRKEND